MADLWWFPGSSDLVGSTFVWADPLKRNMLEVSLEIARADRWLHVLYARTFAIDHYQNYQNHVDRWC